MSRFGLVLGFLALVALAPGRSIALDESEGNIASLTEIGERIDSIVGEIQDLVERRSAAPEAFRVILDQRIDDARVSLHTAIGNARTAVEAERQAGFDVTSMVAKLGDVLQTESANVRQEIAHTTNVGVAILGRLQEASREESSKLTDLYVDNNDRSIAILEAFALTAQHKEALGFDAGLEKTYLHGTLRERGVVLSAYLKIVARRIASVRDRLDQVDDDAELSADLGTLERIEAHAQRALASTIALMAAEGLETGDLLAALPDGMAPGQSKFGARTAVSATKGWASEFANWAKKNAPRAAFRIALFFVVLSLFQALAVFVKQVVRRGLDASDLDLSLLLKDFFTNTAARGVTLIGLLVALAQVGIDLGPALAGLGVAGFVIGFALQDSLSNFAAGMMILVYRPYDIGDLIKAAGVVGTVSHQSLVSTTVKTLTNETVIIPNSKLWGDVITNVSAEGTLRVDLVFGIGYGDDSDRATTILSEILSEHSLVLDTPEAVVKLHNLADSAVEFVVRPWVNAEDYWTVYWDVTRDVKRRFDAESISIPFPQQDVHLMNPPS